MRKKKGGRKRGNVFPTGLPMLIPVNDTTNFKILGLDLAKMITGWSVLDQDENLLGSGTIEFTNLKKANTKYFSVYFNDELNKILQEYKPDAVIIEDIHARFNMTTFKVLAKMHGLAEYIIENYDTLMYNCHPSQARKIALNAGHATKEEAYAILSERYEEFKIYNITYDISDSIVLALCGVKATKGEYYREETTEGEDVNSSPSAVTTKE